MTLSKVNKRLAAGAIFMLVISGFPENFRALAAVEKVPALSDILEFSILIRQTQVLQIRKHMSEVRDEEGLEATLEELKFQGDEALKVLAEQQIKRANTQDGSEVSRILYESRVNTLIASAIAGFRFVL